MGSLLNKTRRKAERHAKGEKHSRQPSLRLTCFAVDSGLSKVACIRGMLELACAQAQEPTRLTSSQINVLGLKSNMEEVFESESERK